METLWQQAQYIDWTCYRCILHLQQYSRRLNLFVNFFNAELKTADWTTSSAAMQQQMSSALLREIPHWPEYSQNCVLQNCRRYPPLRSNAAMKRVQLQTLNPVCPKYCMSTSHTSVSTRLLRVCLSCRDVKARSVLRCCYSLANKLQERLKLRDSDVLELHGMPSLASRSSLQDCIVLH